LRGFSLDHVAVRVYRPHWNAIFVRSVDVGTKIGPKKLLVVPCLEDVPILILIINFDFYLEYLTDPIQVIQIEDPVFRTPYFPLFLDDGFDSKRGGKDIHNNWVMHLKVLKSDRGCGVLIASIVVNAARLLILDPQLQAWRG